MAVDPDLRLKLPLGDVVFHFTALEGEATRDRLAILHKSVRLFIVIGTSIRSVESFGIRIGYPIPLHSNSLLTSNSNCLFCTISFKHINHNSHSYIRPATMKRPTDSSSVKNISETDQMDKFMYETDSPPSLKMFHLLLYSS